ncbi:SAM-dependent methyltransferase [Streptomyces sp. NPDC002920]
MGCSKHGRRPCGEGLMGRKYVLDRAVDFTKPSVARMYDFYLDGHDNYPADRKACGELLQRAPARALAHTQRRFLRRAVRHLAQHHGIRQFLDIGCGFPTGTEVHHIAQDITADARVAYVDKDPMVVSHGRALLEGDGRTAVVQADLRDPDTIFHEPRLTDLIDFASPIGVLLVSVLHGVPDSDDPTGAVARIIDRLPPGSLVVISHLVTDDAHAARDVSRYMRTATDWGRVRERHEVDRYFDHLQILPPGLGDVDLWKHADHPHRTHRWIEYGGVALVP